MKKNPLYLTLLLLCLSLTAAAQRFTDRLDRGLVAMKVSNGVFVSWRIQADEYYDVTYNLYRNGTKIAENLKVSNYSDAGGSTTSTYQVAAVVRGKEQARCAAVSTWKSDYMTINPLHDPSLTCTYIPNDACCVDVDGDGVVEILLKYTNKEESESRYPVNGGNGNKEYTLFEVLKLDGTVLWWVNCGPNMGDFQNNEQNIVGYDWDQDGKGEVVMRLCEGATIHMADGTTYVLGADGTNGGSWTNQRKPKGEGSTEWFTYYGNEYLFYCEGATGKPYQVMPYPLKRLEDGEGDLNAQWGDGYGHRSNKFFFGAPYLDGRHPSIFLGRGIYTRHKFAAYDVDPVSHQLTLRWKWYNNTPGPWKGQGYHNYAIVDVDWDGRDEIVWGSMVIDDNGKGLSTTGLGHGDAQHHGDLDPYTWGQEGFFCNEDKPANNYRDLTTAKIYHRYAASGDDGRAIAGNFNNLWPGAMGFSAHEDAISCVTGNVTSGMTKNGVGMNFNCYWDGDLCEETFNGGDNTTGKVYKYGGSTLKEFIGLTNNSTKATPCYKGDILGDWRDEFILRTSDNKLVIYSTTIPTTWRNYSLWYDKQYRNGMVWEPCGYNQPPHTSYFLGELEGITVAPPAETNTGRTEIANGGTITSTNDVVMMAETNDMTVNVQDGATPYIFIDNAPSWVQGWAPSESSAANDPSRIQYTYYTHTIKGGAFAGDMRLVKQGEGYLQLPNVVQTYTGNTDVWGGKLNFDGTLQNSRLWLNRHTTLNTDGGIFKTIQADYNATIRPGGETAKASTITADSLILNFGARVVIDIYGADLSADKINTRVLKIEKKTWPNGGGPAYDTPVFSIVPHVASGAKAIADGRYLIGSASIVDGNIEDIVIEGMTGQKATLVCSDGMLYLDVVNYVGEPLTWKGTVSSNWNLDNEANFANQAGEAAKFVTGSSVTFDDSAAKTTVNVEGNPSPSQIIFNNTKAYTISGDSIVGGTTVTKNNAGNVVVNNINRIGNTVINAGKITVSTLAAKAVGNEYGALGGVSNTITIGAGATLSVSNTTTSEQRILFESGEVGGKIEVASGATLTQTARFARTATADAVLTKTGSGSLTLPNSLLIQKLVIAAGNVNTVESNGVNILPATVEFQGGTLTDTNSEGSYSSTNANFVVPAGKTGTLHCDPRCEYKGTLTGAGTFNVYASGVRCYLNGNWSNFEGELVAMTEKRGSYDPSTTYWNNTYGLPKATLNVPNGYTFNNNGKPMKIKALKSANTATGKIEGSGALTVGEGYNDNITPYNYITSTLNYKGEEGREMRISSATAGRITGTVNVLSGSLRVNSSTSATTPACGSNTIVLSGTGRLYGTSSFVNNLTVNSGGTYSITNNSGAVTAARAAGSVRVNSGGAVEFLLASATSASKLTVTNTITLSDGAVIRVVPASAFVPAVGKEYTLWTAATFSGSEGNVTFDTAALRAVGRTIDTSKLCATSGVIKIVLLGDVNGDGIVSIQDANLVVNKALGKTVSSFNAYAADMNGDGKITIEDANAIVNLFLGK